MLARGDEITEDILEKMLSVNQAVKVPVLPINGVTFKQSRDYIMNLFEKQFIGDKLKALQGKVTSAARSSGITRQNFQRMMKKFNIKAEDFK